MGFLSRLLGGNDTKVATTAPTTTTSTAQYDNRVVLGNNATQVGAYGEYASNSHNTNETSFLVNDSSSHDVSYTTIGTDGGAVKIAEFNAQLLRELSQDQGDTVKLIAQMGADNFTKQTQAATDLFATSSTAAERAWTHTIDESSEIMDRLLLTAKDTISGANAIASQAVSSFEPTENKSADTIKYAAIAAAVLVGLKVLNVKV